MWYSDELSQMKVLHTKKYSENESKIIASAPMHDVMKELE
jgi:hypothetical protein